MQPDFWHNRWQSNQIGFHLSEANPLLVKHFPALNLPQGARVFLPLCGKSLDIHWLLAQGVCVVGAELSKIAVEALFADLNLTPALTKIGDLTRYSAKNIDIFNGDFFALNAQILGKVDAVYDRAALVALPENMRKNYTVHLMSITTKAQQVLVSFDYDQSQIDGPPFSVNAAEIAAHYAKNYQLNLLERVELPGGIKGKCLAFEEVWHLSPQ